MKKGLVPDPRWETRKTKQKIKQLSCDAEFVSDRGSTGVNELLG